ncbi:MAG: IS3 family transposase [Bacteroidales bacterium]
MEIDKTGEDLFKPPNGGLELYQMVKEYIQFYNEKRRHTEIGKMPPNQKYYHKNGIITINY